MAGLGPSSWVQGLKYEHFLPFFKIKTLNKKCYSPWSNNSNNLFSARLDFLRVYTF